MRWFLSLGGLGVAGFVAEIIDERVSDALLLIAFLLCIVSAYGVLVLRGRKRGEGVLQSLQMQYAARLTKFERGFWLFLGGGLVVLSMPITLAPTSWISLLFGAYALYLGATGRPPLGPSRTASSDKLG